MNSKKILSFLILIQINCQNNKNILIRQKMKLFLIKNKIYPLFHSFFNKL
jgi:hypothetical protein